jgi:integrase/recombinase XerD
MTALRQRLIEDMQLRNFSPHTIEAYVRAVAHFSKRHGRSPGELTGEQVRQPRAGKEPGPVPASHVRWATG